MKEINEKMNHMNTFAPQKAIKPMKKTSSFCAIKLSGHLFDTLAINKILDLLEQRELKFNFVDFSIGNAEH